VIKKCKTFLDVSDHSINTIYGLLLFRKMEDNIKKKFLEWRKTEKGDLKGINEEKYWNRIEIVL